MTNAEKFKEVFGFYPDAHPSEEMCDFVFCDEQECESCRYSVKGKKLAKKCWDDEYQEVSE